MSKKEFDIFIDKHSKKLENKKEIDWDSKRDEWLEYLDQFFQKLEEYLDEYVKDKKISYKYTDKKIFEDYIGEYSVKILNLELGEHKLKLEPIGTNLIGAKGRVDLIGGNGTAKFVLVDKNASRPNTKVNIWINGEKPPETKKEPQIIEWDWKISTPPPRIEYINLEQDSFLGTIMEVIGA